MKKCIIFSTLLFIFLSCNTKVYTNNIESIGNTDGFTTICVATKSNKQYSRLIKEGFGLISTMKSLSTDSNFIHLCCYNPKVIKEVQILNTQEIRYPSQIFVIKHLERNIQNQENLQDHSKNIFINRMVKSIPLKINSFEGSSWLAASCLLTVEKTFIDKKLKDSKLLIFLYDNGLNVFVLFNPQTEHIVQTYACFVKNKELSNIHKEEELIHFFDEYLHISNINAQRL